MPWKSYGQWFVSPDEVHTWKGYTVGDYKFVEMLGRGCFGAVVKVERVSDKVEFALKIAQQEPDLQTEVEAGARMRELLEASKYKVVHAPFEVQRLTYSGWCNDFFMIAAPSEIAEESLESCIAKGTMTDLRFHNLAKDLTNAVKIVHEANMIHRDVTPDNILRKNDEHWMLVDFGVAHHPDAGRGVETFVYRTVVAKYIPPEIHKQIADFKNKHPLQKVEHVLKHSGVKFKYDRNFDWYQAGKSLKLAAQAVWGELQWTTDSPDESRLFIEACLLEDPNVRGEQVEVCIPRLRAMPQPAPKDKRIKLAIETAKAQTAAMTASVAKTAKAQTAALTALSCMNTVNIESDPKRALV